jgi:hypothetical protein
VTEQLQLPVRPGGEPVVVVAIEHDRRIGADPRLREELREVLAAGDVAADSVGELARPVPADGARQMALVVGGGVDVDFDEPHLRIVEVLFGPVGGDEGVGGVPGNGHREAPCELKMRSPSGRVDEWSRVTDQVDRARSRHNVISSSLPCCAIEAAEGVELFPTGDHLALGLANDPRVDS